PRALRARVGAPARPNVRRAGGRRGALRTGDRPPPAARSGTSRRRGALACRGYRARLRSLPRTGAATAARLGGGAGRARMPAPRPRPFELVPLRGFTGAPSGPRRSARRGEGDEVAGTRPYRPGDHRANIHWPASARLSAARSTDEFVVREFYADEAPAVAIACDRRPAMALEHDGLPWLDKRAATVTVLELIAASAAAERADLVYADGAHRPFWVRSGAAGTQLARRIGSEFTAPCESLRLALDALVRQTGELPPGSFVFVCSDFLEPVAAGIWLHLRARGWDVVPVVVQDPVWEQSFPAVGGVVVPLAD